MSFDLAFWKHWEGHSLDSMFPLERCLGGSDHSAVFETQFQGRPAVKTMRWLISISTPT